MCKNNNARTIGNLSKKHYNTIFLKLQYLLETFPKNICTQITIVCGRLPYTSGTRVLGLISHYHQFVQEKRGYSHLGVTKKEKDRKFMRFPVNFKWNCYRSCHFTTFTPFFRLRLNDSSTFKVIYISCSLPSIWRSSFWCEDRYSSMTSRQEVATRRGLAFCSISS